MTDVVIRTYGWDTSGPSTASSTGERGRCRHQETAKKLAGNIAANLGWPARKFVRVNNNRRTAVVVIAYEVSTKLLKRIQ